METSLVFLGPKMSDGLAIMTTSLLNFRNYEINGRFVTNLEPKFKIEHVIEHHKVNVHEKDTIYRKKIENGSNPSEKCIF